MENLKKVTWFNQIAILNDNFEALEEAVNDIEGGVVTPQSNITNIATTTNITTVPASFADTSAVQSYLAGANVIPNIQTRLSNLEGKVNNILVALRAAGILNV